MQSSDLIIDLDTIQKNVERFAQIGSVMAMIKANAYGTGALQIAPFLLQYGVEILGVSHVNEGIELRKGGVSAPIFVLSCPPFEAQKAVDYDLQPAVSSLEEAEALNRAAKHPLPVHLHINTGMSRFGVDSQQALPLYQAILQLPRLHLEGVMTHFSSSDKPELDGVTHEQIAIFQEILRHIDPLPRWIHAANGQGAVRFSLPFCNLVRIGYPLFQNALTFESHLAFIQMLKRGERVGYYGNYEVKCDKLPVGVIPVGYYDGFHRHYHEKGYVMIQEKRAPMIGHICMDFMMVDLSGIPEARVGDRVTLFGENPRPETVACWGHTDIRELLVSIGPRTQRTYKRNTDEQRLPSPFCPIEENPPSRQHLLPT